MCGLQYSYKAQKGEAYSHFNKPWRRTTKQQTFMSSKVRPETSHSSSVKPLSLCHGGTVSLSWHCFGGLGRCFSLYWKTHAQITADHIRFYRLLNGPACSSTSCCQCVLSAYCLNEKSKHPMKNWMYLLDPTSPFQESATIRSSILACGAQSCHLLVRNGHSILHMTQVTGMF